MSNQKIIESVKINKIIDNYNINKFFEDYVLQKEYYPYQFNSWKENKFYGIIDKQNRAIYPKQSALQFNTNDNNTIHKNLFFVVDAFQDLKRYHKSFLLNNKFDTNASTYVNLNIVSTGNDLDVVYVDYLNNLFNIFFSTYLTPTRISSIKGFDDFVKVFISFVRLIAPYSPIMRSSFIKSRLCSPTVSGLTIDIAEYTSFTDTKIKADKFISDPNFDVFLENAKRFGFLIDKNIPWRLIADLESPVMKDYYRRYNLENVDEVLSTCYHVAYYSDLEILKNNIVSFWNTYANKENFSTEQSQMAGCSSLFAEINSYNQIDVESFDKNYNINWLIRLYLFIKVYEFAISMTQNNFEIIYNESIKLNAYSGQDVMLDYVDRKMQELSSRGKQQKTILTSPDEAIKMVSSQSRPSAAERINF